MEGYLRIRLNPLIRRLLTRSIAIIPAVIVIGIFGEGEVDNMLIFSQVLLSMQLAFAVIPLIHFVSDKKRMGLFAIKPFTQSLAWLIAIIIVTLNMHLVIDQALSWQAAGDSLLTGVLIWTGIGGLFLLLIVTFAYPYILKRKEFSINIHDVADVDPGQAHAAQPFHTIALALDYSDKDRHVIRYALQLANPETRFVLIHIVESAPARMIGSEIKDYETIGDQKRLDQYIKLFADRGYSAEGALGFRNRAREIARLTGEAKADLLVVGSHGHRTIKDWLFGQTINSLRHMVSIPVFIAQ